MAEAISRIIGTNMQTLVCKTQKELVPIKQRYPGVSIVALETVKSRWATDDMVIKDQTVTLTLRPWYLMHMLTVSDPSFCGPQEDLIKLSSGLPPGAHWAVNQIKLNGDQLKMKLRQRLWWYLLGDLDHILVRVLQA